MAVVQVIAKNHPASNVTRVREFMGRSLNPGYPGEFSERPVAVVGRVLYDGEVS
jgi:hypothetical protein